MNVAEFATAVLAGLNAPASPSNLHALDLWVRAESGASPFRWNNPLNTTWGMPGDEKMNSVGVRKYRTIEDGITATVKTLSVRSFGYPAVVGAFRASAPIDTVYDAINKSSWCRGCSEGRYPKTFLAELAYDHPPRPKAPKGSVIVEVLLAVALAGFVVAGVLLGALT